MLILYSVNPPRLVGEGTSTLQAAMPGKLKSPHFKVPSGGGDFSFPDMAACKVEVPPPQVQVLGGSRWPDPAV